MDKNKLNSKGDKRIGYWEEYYPDNTTIRYKGHYNNDGQQTGLWTYYYSNGEVWQTGNFHKSIHIGYWLIHTPNNEISTYYYSII